MSYKLGMKLGSKPLDHGALKLEEYLTDSPPAVPQQLSLPAASLHYPWGMLGNDTVGDCVEAGMLHAEESYRLRNGGWPRPWQTHNAISLYSTLGGYVAGDESTDQGTDPVAACKYWQSPGIFGHELAGFGVLDPTSPHIRRAMWEFGAVLFAIALPTSAQPQGVNWRYAGNTHGQNAVGSWGGHLVAGMGYTASVLQFISWAELGDMDNPFADAYLEQVLVPLTRDSLNAHLIGPAGFDFAKMTADLPTL